MDAQNDSAIPDLIARRVVDALQAERDRDRSRFLSATDVAKLLGVEPEWVRSRSAELGAVRLGDGPKARLRFTRAAIDAYLSARAVQAAAPLAERKSQPDRAMHIPAGDRKAPRLHGTGEAVIEW